MQENPSRPCATSLGYQARQKKKNRVDDNNGDVIESNIQKRLGVLCEGFNFCVNGMHIRKSRARESKRELKTIRPHLDAAALTLNQRFTILITLTLLLYP